jgi:HAE1 family hydrophobic/amphiphilic exporter-1
MGEISTAIISITLVMSAVFVPVTFLGGSVGVFYKQFGSTLAVAIVLSAANALTLSPALCAVFLRAHEPSGDVSRRSLGRRFFTAFNAAFDALTHKYTGAVRAFSKRAWLSLVVITGFAVVLVYLMRTMPSGFVPEEDQGTIFASITLPPASSLERTGRFADQVDQIAHELPEVRDTLRIVGQNFLAGAGSANAMVIIKLIPWDRREDAGIDVVMGRLRQRIAGLREGDITLITPPTVSGFSASGGFSFQLQDRAGHSIDEFAKRGDEFLAALNQQPEIRYARTAFKTTFPQYQLAVNVAKCEEAGITPASVLDVMQGYFGGIYTSNINQFGKQYRVMVQADNAYRASEANLASVYVRTGGGAMAPITAFVRVSRVYGPQTISRFNLFTSIDVNGAPKEGFSTGDAIAAIQRVAAQKLPAGYGYEFSGITREELTAGRQSTYVFLLCLVFVYLLLAAQYESYVLPFAVLLSLPVGLAGTFLLCSALGIDNNIYVQIALIMLIGLLAKNAILIVEYAVTIRRRGTGLIESAVDGARTRFRPILMTSIAFVFGLTPLMLASGAGASGNRAIGTAAVGGMLLGTLIAPLVIPPLYVLFQALHEKIVGEPQPEAAAEPVAGE